MTDYYEKSTGILHIGKTVKIFLCIFILFFPPISILINHTQNGSVTSRIIVADPISGTVHSALSRDTEYVRDTSIMSYEDVILIVNDNSQMSKDIADYFIANRDFPPGNIINISAPSGETISLAQFADLREQVEDNITSRNLTTKIYYIITT